MADVATSLALGPTQTVSGLLSPGTSTAVDSFLGAAGSTFIDLQQASGDQVSYELVGPDGLQIFGASSSGVSAPVTLTEAGTYDLLIEGASSSSIATRFRITDTAILRSPSAPGLRVPQPGLRDRRV